MPWARGRRTVLLVDTTTRTRYADEPGRVSDAGGQARRKLLAMLPLTERRIEAAGVSTAVLEGGAGPPLVLQHGGIECGGVVWGPVLSRLAERHRLVVPDLPGLGESEPVDRLDTKTFLEWFAALLEATCDEEPVLVAHSLLGSLAPIAAQALGLRKLIIYAAPGIGPYRMPLGLMAAAIRFNLRPTQRNQERFERWAFRDADRTRRQDEHWFEAFDAYTVACGRVPHVKRTMRQLVKTGTKRVPDAELRRVGVPLALLWGRHDRMVPLHVAEGAASRLGWPLYVVDDAGHVPHIEQPDAFLEALDCALHGSQSKR